VVDPIIIEVRIGSNIMAMAGVLGRPPVITTAVKVLVAQTIRITDEAPLSAPLNRLMTAVGSQNNKVVGTTVLTINHFLTMLIEGLITTVGLPSVLRRPMLVMGMVLVDELRTTITGTATGTIASVTSVASSSSNPADIILSRTIAGGGSTK